MLNILMTNVITSKTIATCVNMCTCSFIHSLLRPASHLPFPILSQSIDRSFVCSFVLFHVFILSLSLSLWFYLMISSECHECIYISPELEINKIERKPKSSPGSHAHAALQYPTNCRHFHKFFLSLLLTLFCPIQSLLFFFPIGYL